MKCKVCGAQNPDYLEYCENCAALLEGPAETPVPTAPKAGGSAWGFARAPQWPQPDFNANTITEEEIPAEYVQRYGDNSSEPVENAAEVIQAVPEEEGYPEEEPVSQVRVRTRVNRTTAQSRYDDDTYNDEEDEDYPSASVSRRSAPKEEQFFDYDRRKYSGKRRAPSKHSHSSRKKTILFYGAAGLLVVVIAVLLVVFLTRGSNDSEQPSAAAAAAAQPAETDAEATGSQQKPAFLGGLFSKSPITKPATIEKDTTGSETAYIITVYTKSNCSYRFTAGTLINEGAVDGRSVSLRIPEQVWMPTEPVDGEVYEVIPDVVVINKDGEETPVEFAEAISIALPTLNLTLTNPLETSLSVSAPTVDITGTVDNNTAEVYVNDMQLPVDSTGGFAGTYTLPGIGTQVVNVEARKNGYAIARKTLNIEYATDVAADGTAAASGVAAESGTPAFTVSADLVRRTTSAALTVTGTVESGATLTVEGVTLNGQVTTNATAGTFEFTVDMQEVGLYTAVISSNKGGVTGSRTVYLERGHADSNAYMEGCHALDYQYLRDSPYHKQGYMISGKVVEIIQATPFVIARMTTDAGDIVFHYYNTVATVEANDGKTYKVYADPYGRYEADPEVPVVYAWYIKKSG